MDSDLFAGAGFWALPPVAESRHSRGSKLSLSRFPGIDDISYTIYTSDGRRGLSNGQVTPGKQGNVGFKAVGLAAWRDQDASVHR